MPYNLHSEADTVATRCTLMLLGYLAVQICLNVLYTLFASFSLSVGVEGDDAVGRRRGHFLLFLGTFWYTQSGCC